MNQLKTESIDCERWLILVKRFCDYSYWQSLNYGAACARRQGAQSEHSAIYNKGDLIGLAEVRMRKLPLLGSGIAYVGGGPLTRLDSLNGEIGKQRFAQCLQALRDEYVLRRGLVLRILAPIGLPEWNADISNVMIKESMEQTDLSPRYRTMLVDINKQASSIRESFGRRWRRGLREAERNEIQLRIANKVDDIEKFCEMYEKMRIHKSFDVNLDAKFFSNLLEQSSEEDEYELLLAEADSQLIAGILTCTLGETCVYLIGASNDKGRQLRASFLLHWKSIMAANKRGMRWYDVGGIDPVADSGGYTFKSGMGGVDVEAAGPFDASPSGLSGKVMPIVETCYRISRRIRNKLPSLTQNAAITAISTPTDS